MELCFLSVPKKSSFHIINTIIISCYILKSIEIVIFEPALLIIVILNFPEERIVIILIFVDIIKYITLNIYLVIFSETGQRNTIKI